MRASPDHRSLINELRAIVGRSQVLTGDRATRRFRSGYRFGSGEVAAVVRPGSLVEQWRVLGACVAFDAIVITQAANTGLTGGSTPQGCYDRPVVIVNVMRLDGIQPIAGGTQVICLPGATLDRLERTLAPLGRDPHSVIGSSCFGASVVGGVCNNSGGALIQRGPAYTELALFARVDEDGQVHLVNHLGVSLGNDPETILTRLEQGRFTDADISHDPGHRASDHDYHSHVRLIDEPTPARFNADRARLFEASGSAGRLMVFAVRLDTFAAESSGAVFYIGTNDPDELSRLRREMLAGFANLPVSAEYLHRDAFDIAARYGKDSFLAIRRLGTRRLPALIRAKDRADRLAARVGLGEQWSDRAMQRVAGWLPDHLPARMRDFRDRYEHHLILKMGGAGIDEAREWLGQAFPSAVGDMFECTPDEAAAAMLHRFVTAGAAVRYRTIHPDTVEDIAALDVALPRDTVQWREELPSELRAQTLHILYYGHFFCHVFHQDYLLAKGHDPEAFEHQLLDLFDARGAEYPAEHNVGHLYPAKPDLADFYRELDPGNRLNPGIGKTSKARFWR